MVTIIHERDYDEFRITNMKTYFRSAYQREWMLTDFTKEAVKGIDLTEPYIEETFNSPWLGIIGPFDLSNGVRSVIFCRYAGQDSDYHPIISSVNFGDNCIPYIAKASFDSDFTIIMDHFMDFSAYKDLEINAQTVDGVPLRTCMDVYEYDYCRYVGEVYKNE